MIRATVTEIQDVARAIELAAKVHTSVRSTQVHSITAVIRQARIVHWYARLAEQVSADCGLMMASDWNVRFQFHGQDRTERDQRIIKRYGLPTAYEVWRPGAMGWKYDVTN